MNFSSGEQIPFELRTPTVGAVIDVCDQQAEHPQDGDPFIRAYAVAAADHLRHHQLGRIVQLALDIRAVDPPRPGNIFNLSRVEVHRQSFQIDPEHYPDESYVYPAKYHENIGIITSEKPRRRQLIQALERNRINASVGERYKSHKALMGLLAPRIGTAPRLLDVGSGEFQGLKQLHFSYLVPFEPVVVVSSSHHESVEEVTLLNGIINDLISSSEGVPGLSVGIEPVRPDEKNADWFLASSIKPSEFLNRKRLETFTALRTLKSRNIHAYWREFTPSGMAGFASAEFQRETPFERAEVVSFATVLNQLSSKQIEPTRALAREYITDNGIILYQDRFMPDPKDPTKLAFLPSYNDFNYRTLIEFANDPTHRLYDLFQWETGRCQVMRPGPNLEMFLAGEIG